MAYSSTTPPRHGIGGFYNGEWLEGARRHSTSLVAYLQGLRLYHRGHVKQVSWGSERFGNGDKGGLGELVGKQ